MTGPRGDLPLSGIRVLELGNFIAAPTAGRLLADFGAEVIKVERPRSGDELRRWRLYSGDTSMLFRVINRNKKSIELDLHSEAGQQIVRDLVAECDVVLENFRPGTLERWGLSPDDLTAINPELIVVRISAFGQTGPLAGRPGFAAVAEAFGGLRALVGEADRPPSRVGVSIGDTIAGLYAAFGAVMMLLARRGGAHAGSPPSPPVDVALSEAILSVMESLIPDYEAFGVVRQRTGGRMEGIAPSNAYACCDGGGVIIAGNSNALFTRLMMLIGRPDLAEDPELADNVARWARRDELDDAIDAWTARHTVDEALAQLATAGVPAGPVNTAADIVREEQFAARRMIQRLDVSTGAEVLPQVGFPGIVPVLGGESLPITSLGPELGEHTTEVLSSLLGLSAEEVHWRTNPAKVRR